MKPNLLSLRRRRRHQLSNRVEYYLKLAIVPLLQFLQLPRQLSIGSKNLSQATKARTTSTLARTARSLLSTFAAMIAPCSVKAYGR